MCLLTAGEFSANASVPRKETLRIEWLLRKGERQLDLLSSSHVKNAAKHTVNAALRPATPAASATAATETASGGQQRPQVNVLPDVNK
jgi:hypothetical protein